MRLESIGLSNWKIFRDPVELEFSPGLNILYGANESGKSTLIDAIRMVFFNKHTAKSQKIKEIVPWGSNLSPHAKICFEEDGAKYRISKSFISPESVLDKYYDDRWNRIAEGDKADKELVNILGGQLPNRGESKSEFWGVGQSLWMIQGDPIIEDDLNPQTVSSLKGLIGAAIESAEEKSVLNTLDKEFGAVYTKTGKLSTKSELSKLIDELNDLKEKLNSDKQNKIKKDDLIHDIEDKEYFLKKEEKELSIAKEEKLKISNNVKLAHEHRNDRLSLENDYNTLDLEYKNLKSVIDDIDDSKNTIQKLNEKMVELQLQVEPLQNKFDNNKENLRSISEQVTNIELEIDNLSDNKRLASIAHTTVMDEQELTRLLSAYKTVEELHNKLDEREQEIKSLNSPSLEELEHIEGLAAKILNTETRLDAIGLTIETNLQNPFKLYLDGDENPTDIGEGNQSYKAHQAFILKSDELGIISVKSGSDDVKSMKENLIELKNEFQESVSPFDNDNPQDLREIYNNKIRLEGSLTNLQDNLSKQPVKDIEELNKEIAKSKKKIELNWIQISSESQFYKYKDEEDLLNSRVELSYKINELEEEIDDLKSNKKKLKETQEEELTIKEELLVEISNLNSDLSGNKERIDQVKEQLEKKEDDGLTTEERNDKLNNISTTLDKKERALKVYKNEIEEKETTPLSQNTSIDNSIEKLQDTINKHNVQYAGLKKELEILINNSQDITKLEEKLDKKENEFNSLETEAKAYELLHDLSIHYKKNTLESLSDPVNKILGGYLEKLLGSKYVFDLCDNIKPEFVDVVGAEEKATVDCLSFGTQEQIWCLFRLALGQLLSRDERQLVILDDPFVNTDEARLNRALEILEDTARDVQIILVTCDLDKYSSLGGKFIELEKGSLIDY